MVTPDTNRLHGIEGRCASTIEDSFDLFSSVKDSLIEIAAINHETVLDLGPEGGTANAARRILGGTATGLYENTDNLQKIINVSKDALASGIQAKHESTQIQSDLTKVDSAYISKITQGGKSAGSQGTPEVVIQSKAQCSVAHAEVEERAMKTLSTLNGRTLTVTGGFPSQGQIRVILGKNSSEFVEQLARHMGSRRQVGPGNTSPRVGSASAHSATD